MARTGATTSEVGEGSGDVRVSRLDGDELRQLSGPRRPPSVPLDSEELAAISGSHRAPRVERLGREELDASSAPTRPVERPRATVEALDPAELSTAEAVTPASTRRPGPPPQVAMERAPETAAGWARHGDRLAGRGQLVEAQEAYREAIRREPCVVAYRVALAEAALRLHALRDAAAELRLAHEMDPSDVSVLVSLGRVHMEMRSRDRAIQCLRRAVTLEPHRRDALTLLWALESGGDEAETCDPPTPASRLLGRLFRR